MDHTSQQFPDPYLPWPQVNPYHPGPLAHPHTSPGQFRYPTVEQSTFFQPQSSVQILSQELAAAQRKVSQYTDLISNLYTELETIRNIVCPGCKERISPANLVQHPLQTESHHGGIRSEQTTPANITPDTPSSPTPSRFPVIPTTPKIPTRKLPATLNVNETAGAIIDKSQWSVEYNSGTKRLLDITFVHAFKHTSPVNDVRFSPDGSFLAVGLTYDLGRTQIYDVMTKSLRCVLAEYSGYTDKNPPCGVWCVRFSPDGRHLVVGSKFKTYIWKIASGRLLAALKGHTGAVRCLDVSPNGRLLVTGSNDGSVRIWRMRDGYSKPLSKEGTLVITVRFSPNGRYVTASNLYQNFQIWDVRTGKLVRKWKVHKLGIRCMAFTPNGEELVSGSWGGAMMSWDVSSLNSPPRSSLPAEEYNGLLIQKKKKREFDKHSGEVRSVSISPDGKWVISGSSEKQVCIWDIHTAVRQCRLQGHVDELWAVDFSPDGNYIATGSKDGFVTLWKYKTL